MSRNGALMLGSGLLTLSIVHLCVVFCLHSYLYDPPPPATPSKRTITHIGRDTSGGGRLNREPRGSDPKI